MSYGLILAFLYMGCGLLIFFRQDFMRRLELEILIDGGFIIGGLVALIWHLLGLPF
jgi:hypothetical protein